jgi:hypothetical protein
MLRHVVISALGLALTAAASHAQTPAPTAPAREQLNIPTGERWLGSVHIPVAVLADGQPLAVGRYRVRLTGQAAEKNAVGQLEALERWVEFVRQNDVKGRTMASVVPDTAVEEVAEGRAARAGSIPRAAIDR